MKNIFRKLSCALLAAAMICAITPFTANAATGINYPKTQTLYKSGKFANSYGYGGISINNIPTKSSISKSNVKIVSGKGIVELDSLTNSTWRDRTEYFGNGLKPYTYSNHYYNIGLRVKKPGTAKISFKVGNKTYTSVVKVVAYSNPVKSLTIQGTSGNLATNFKTSNSGSFQIKKAQKNALIRCTAASGWKISSVNFSNSKTGIQRSVYCNSSKGISSLTLHAGNITAKQSGYISVTLINIKTGGTQNCHLSLLS